MTASATASSSCSGPDEAPARQRQCRSVDAPTSLMPSSQWLGASGAIGSSKSTKWVCAGFRYSSGRCRRGGGPSPCSADTVVLPWYEPAVATEQGHSGEFQVAVGDYVFKCVPDGLPLIFDRYVEHARLVERFTLETRSVCCLTVGRAREPWPFLVVAQGFFPSGGGFNPGFLLAAETQRLFLGAGERLVAYDLMLPRRLWTDTAESGFWGWEQHGDVILMAAELELAAWTSAGEKLWTMFVEPPWGYVVENGSVLLDVMGRKSQFSIRAGPPHTS